MGIQRYTLASGEVRYRARVKSHGREVATHVFERKKDAEAWEGSRSAGSGPASGSTPAAVGSP